jgi:uncharacterized membrane protein
VNVLAVQTYDVVEFVHVAAVVLAFGPTFGYAFFQTIAERSHPRSVPYVMRVFTRIDRTLVTPGMLVVLAAGIYLTADRWEFSDLFVVVGLVAIIALLAFAHGFFIRTEGALAELAERDIAASGSGEVTFSDEYWKLSKRVAIIGALAGLIVMVTIFFMVVKP